MANANASGDQHGFPWRILGWGSAALILLLPLIAMRFTTEVNWTVGDFLVAGLLMGIVGISYELAVRVSRSYAYRGGVAGALAAAFLIIWVNGAVGMIGDEDNSYNLLFLGVIAVALAGSVAARFRPGGMIAAMATAAAAQIAVAFGGLSADPRGAIFSAILAGPWILSAVLFWKAARDRQRESGSASAG